MLLLPAVALPVNVRVAVWPFEVGPDTPTAVSAPAVALLMKFRFALVKLFFPLTTRF